MGRLTRRLGRVSDAVLRAEKILAATLGAAVFGLILLNVVTRSLNVALFWVDELAIFAAVWMGLIGASIAVRQRSAVAVTLLIDAVPPYVRRPFFLAIDLVTLGFAVLLLGLSWMWFDPLTLAGLGGDVGAFQAETFNFIYSQPTNTIGVAKFWAWLVVPLVALTMTLHGLANMVEAVFDPHTGRTPMGDTA